MRVKKATAQRYREIADLYVRETGCAEYDVLEVIEWAMKRGDLPNILSREQVVELYRAQMSDSLRGHMIIDEQGRKVRLRHCVVVKVAAEDGQLVQRTLWSHIDDASEMFLRTSIDQRYKEQSDSIERLKADVDFINVRFSQKGLKPIQLSFKF